MVNSLGKVTVTTPGTLVRVTSLQADPTLRIGAQTVRIQALPGNTDYVYVGLYGLNTTTGAQVLGIIGVPPTAGGKATDLGVWEMGLAFLPAGINLADLYLDAAHSGDGVIVCYTAN